jgi:integrase
LSTAKVIPTDNRPSKLKIEGELNVSTRGGLNRAAECGSGGHRTHTVRGEAPAVTKGSTKFCDFDEYERLVDAARRLDARTHLIALLGGEGLRCGEMIALEWADVDLAKRQVCIQRSDWNGQVTSPKGGRLRYVPLTLRLAAALREHRHLRGKLVLSEDDGGALTRQKVQYRVKRAAGKANVVDGVHVLRHTFCSHLAMRGAPARAIQELAGHSELGTTQRYMHLSPAALDAAIRLLDGRGNSGATEGVGDRVAGNC